jgi:hypothetical protein
MPNGNGGPASRNTRSNSISNPAGGGGPNPNPNPPPPAGHVVNVGNGVDPATLFALLQTSQQQTQQLVAVVERQQQQFELLQKQLAESKQREEERAARPDSRPLPAYNGKPFSGEPSTLEAWIREARLQVARLAPAAQATPRAVDFVAQAFTGPALVWFAQEVEVAARPQSPDALFAAMLARFQPKLAAEQAQDQLFALEQGKMTVTEYSTRFRELLALLPADTLSAAAQVQMFRRGLIDSIYSIVAQAVPQPATMSDMVEMATRVESRAQGGRRAPSAQVAAAEVEPGTGQAILAAISSLTQQLSSTRNGSSQRGASEGNRRREGQTAGSNGSGKTNRPSNDPLNQQSREQRVRLMQKDLCFYCAQSGHRRPDCPVEARGAPPTPAALGN